MGDLTSRSAGVGTRAPAGCGPASRGVACVRQVLDCGSPLPLFSERKETQEDVPHAELRRALSKHQKTGAVQDASRQTVVTQELAVALRLSLESNFRISRWEGCGSGEDAALRGAAVRPLQHPCRKLSTRTGIISLVTPV